MLINKLKRNNSKRVLTFPSKKSCKNFVNSLFELLFGFGVSKSTNTKELEKETERLRKDLELLIFSIVKDKEKAKEHSNVFIKELPFIYDRLLHDAEAILDTDPAARTMEEVLVAYPGFFAIFVYRIAHHLFKADIKILARFFSEYAHSITGIDIHPGATIGHSFAIDHGTGVVIGETSVIGNRVKIFQGVTLGAINVSKEKALTKRHPTVEDNVVIYAGATILGGETTIGNNSIIGGNVWLTNSVPPNCVAYHKSEVHVKDLHPFSEPLNFVI